MNKRFVKIISLALALMMVLSVVPAAVMAKGIDAVSSMAGKMVSRTAPETYPEQTLTQEADGVNVVVESPEGALPKGVQMEVEGVADINAVQTAVNHTVGINGVVLTAVDITFMNAGREIQPRGEVTVTMSASAFAGKSNLRVVHIKADEGSKAGSVEEVEGIVISGDKVIFAADSFSIYAVIGDGETGDRARLTVEFYNGTELIETAIVTKAGLSLIDQTIPDPTIAQDPNDPRTFCGWIIDKPDYDKTDVDGDRTINYVRAAVADRLTDEFDPIVEGEVMRVYAMFFYYYVVSYVGENGDVTVYSEAVLSKVPEVDYEVHMSYSPIDSSQFRFQGWTVVGSGSTQIYENGDHYTVSGDTVFRAKVQRGYWLMFNEDPDDQHKGATYRAPVFIPAGNDGVVRVTSAHKPANPTCVGYTFDEWYTTDSFTQAFSFNGTLVGHTTVYAKWTANTTATYTVLIWKQNLAGDDYDFVESIRLIGTPNAAISSIVVSGTGNNAYVTIQNEAKKYTGFHYVSKSGDTTVKLDNTSVVNVYYDRNEYTLTFQVPNTYTQSSSYGNWGLVDSTYVMLFYRGSDGNYYALDGATSSSYAYYYNGSSYTQINSSRRYVVATWKTADTITALYGQDISSEFPIEGAPEGVLWNPQSSAIFDSEHDVPALETMPAESTTFRMLFYGVEIDYKFYYYVEALPGTANTVSYGGKNYTLHQTITLSGQPGVQSTKSEDMYDITGFTQGDSYPAYGSDGTVELTSAYNYSIKLYYTRNSYKILYEDGAYFDGDQQLIADAADRGYLGESAAILYEASIASYNEGGSNYYEPSYDGYIFEGWYYDKACTKPATFSTMPLDGVTVYAKWQRIQYRVFLHINGGTFIDASQDPDFRVNWGDTVGEPAAERDGYVLIGWFTDPEFNHPYNFSTKLTNETVTEAYTDKLSSDVPRYWITRKLELYAKWYKQLDGASGLTILYNAVSHPDNGSVPGNMGTGVTTWPDPLYYQDGASAIGRSAADPDDGETYVFLYWEIMNPDGTPSGKYVYPGQEFTVDFNDAVMTPRTKLYNSNGEEVQRGADPKADSSRSGKENATRDGEATYQLATSIVAGKTYLIVFGNGTTAAASNTMYVMNSYRVSSSLTGYRKRATPTFADSTKSVITAVDTDSTGTVADCEWTVAAGTGSYSSAFTFINDGYYLVETSASDGNLACDNENAYPNYKYWTVEKASGAEYFNIHNAYWHTQNTSRYYYLYYDSSNSGFTNYYSSTHPQTTTYYRMYLYEKVESSGDVTVTFDANGGSGTMAAQTIPNGTATALNANTFTRTGYTFAGWNTARNGSGTSYTDGQTVTLTADLTLYAQWNVVSSDNVTYLLVDTPVSGIGYILVSGGSVSGTTGYALTNSNASPSSNPHMGATAVTVSGSTLTTAESALNSIVWTPTASGSGYTWQAADGKYIGLSSGGYLQPDTTSRVWLYTADKYFDNNQVIDEYRYLFYSSENSWYSVSYATSSATVINLYARAYTLTVNYVMSDGSAAPASQTVLVAEGANYSVTSPAVAGYTPSSATVSGTMPGSDRTLTVTYSPEETPSSGTEIWVPVNTIDPNEEYLIGIVVSGSTYLISSRNTTSGIHWFTTYNSSSEWVRYQAFMGEAVMDGVNVIGVNGVVVNDLSYCRWKFSTTSGGKISSVAEEGYYLYAQTGTVTNSSSNYYGYTYYDTSADQNNATTWSYNSSNHRLSGTTGSNTLYVFHDTFTDSGVTYDILRGLTGTSNAGYIQLFKKEIVANTYTVQFYGFNGADLGAQTVSEGDHATAPSVTTPTGFNFVGWHKDDDESTLYTSAQVNAMAITADTEFHAVFESESGTATHTVVFVDWDGTILSTQTVIEGEDAVAPSVPGRSGYTFDGWDADYTGVTEDLVVNAVYLFNITKDYTITLRAVYGPKVSLKKTFITWSANNETGKYMESKGVYMNEKIEIPFPDGLSGTGADGAPLIPFIAKGTADDYLVWEGHEFLGWARLPINLILEQPGSGAEIDEGTGYPIDPETGYAVEPVTGRAIDCTTGEYVVDPKLDPTSAEFDTYLDNIESYLFLKYVPADDNTDGDSCGKFQAKLDSKADGDNWQDVQYVAADELMPYHGMFAVWSTVFYVYHSSDNTVDKYSITGDTFDLTKIVKTGYLYGGYYKKYNKTTSTVDQLKALAYGTRGDDGKYTASPKDTNGTSYRGGVGYWYRSQAYAAAKNEARGNELKPVGGTIYYLKEVPNTVLKPYVHLIYNTGDLEGHIDGMYLMTVLDDSNYTSYGLMNNGSFGSAKLATRVVVGDNEAVITAKGAPFNLGGGYVVYLDGCDLIESEADYTYRPYYVTLDGVLVQSLTRRTIYIGDGFVYLSNGKIPTSAETSNGGFYITDVTMPDCW